ncbi:M13 family metallopeptidase [Corynebacterium aquatimens]|uniref:Endopeptidase n=1 Tax=Corynebacterium aquatimens TaxID=1190508 RepID=A0A931E2I9_9CORY|nr:M13-type metalloendopeptidase [Corynebacterium aquatimens]MBG6122601.1 putative endopeptidase [Corynebacterium aquatimens]WJY64859.1 Neutral endopeptidase [Corynebacterium aquatimens]
MTNTDLYRLVNGPWLDSHVIPADRGVDGTFHALRDKAEVDVRDILTASDSLGGTLYDSFMDTESINAAGLAPLKKDFDLLSVKDINEFAHNLGLLERTGIAAPVSYWVEKDSQGETSVPHLVQAGLGLPDEAYYREPAHKETLRAYLDHVERMLGFLDPARLFGLGADVAAQRVVKLEAQIAASHWDVVDSRDALKIYNPREFSDLPQIIQTMLAASGLGPGRVVVMMPSFVDDLAAMLRPDALADWQLWGTWHILRSRAGLVAEEIGTANFDFYGTVLSGATEQRDRWKRGVSLAESLVGEDIGKVYVDKHFPPSSKEQMLELVDYLVSAYRQRISALAWMSEETRGRALTKLEKFRAKIGYPDKWRDYSDLSFSPAGSDLVENVRRGSAFEHDYHVSKVGQPTDRDEWVSTPQTVNAFYHPVVNDITFPAAILQPPFFDPEADAAENFGAIGAVIGHEIGHGFDDQGSRYDGDGNLNSWWTDEDRARFEELTSKLVEQFDGLIPTVLEGREEVAGVNGKFTLGENIGDLGGLGIAIVAYKNYLAEHELDDGPALPFDVDGADAALSGNTYTGMQRLFLAWARVWRTAIRPEMAAQYLAIDPHSPAEFRCNVIAANIDEFYEAFPEYADSAMRIEEKDRVVIW